ncbi:hypothetical protein [Roseisolibacter sp. H3M3-2]|uniref:hypothetical protein n=1 Tax=Roseisolibacter sp. H3M3-2 TaxID=3031323 RepID=UPI0023DB3E7E|nr:hypothetical protein [Roseisolibacter sp. H3M3-2]MDF1506072.1 hypothetical protein [Roseisolibacter sp. H3M3-2]
MHLRARSRAASLLVAASVAAVGACAGDSAPAEPTDPACVAQPSCGADLALALSPALLDAVEDAGTRLVAALDLPADRTRIGTPLQQLRAARAARDAAVARRALTATRDALDAVERGTPGAAVEVAAIRLAIAPLVEALALPTVSVGAAAAPVAAPVR